MKNSNSFRLALACTLIGIAAGISIGCNPDDTLTDKQYTFSGVITDSITGAAVESVSVSGEGLINVPIYSDSAGRYQGATLRGKVTVSVAKQGYQAQSRLINLAGQNLTGVDFKLTS